VCWGAGILNGGTLTINNSTVSYNTIAVSAVDYSACGGGIFNGGGLTINNSTISYNSVQVVDAPAVASGGGIYNSGQLTISNSTVSGNTALNTTTGNGVGGGISGSATLQNSIVADNIADQEANCSGTITSNGYNLSSDSTCNLAGTGDLNNIDPKLGPLGNNGGPTQTEALLPGSPAIDAGNPSGCTDSQGYLLKTDQRGAPRPDKEDTSGCDMGV